MRDRVATPAGLVQRLPRGHLGRGAEPHGPGAHADPRRRTAPARSPRSPPPSAATRTTTSSCGWSGPAFGTNSVDHCTRLCHSTLGGGDEPRAHHRGRLGLHARDRGGLRRHLHLRREHHRDPPGLRRPDQARRRQGRQAHRGRRPRGPSSPSWPTSISRCCPGTDVALYNAMLHHIIAAGPRRTATFIAERTHDFEKVRGGGRALHPGDGARRSPAFPRRPIRARRRDVRPGPAHLDALGHGADPARHRHRHRRQPAQPACSPAG